MRKYSNKIMYSAVLQIFRLYALNTPIALLPPICALPLAPHASLLTHSYKYMHVCRSPHLLLSSRKYADLHSNAVGGTF